MAKAIVTALRGVAAASLTLLPLAAASLVILAPLGAARAQDADAGKKDFAQCSACHSIDGNNGAGPTLKGIAGRKAGSEEGFRFSRAMKNSSVVWDQKSLDAYLAAPQSVVPGNVMPFSGVADAKTRADLTAYLLTLK